MDRVLSKLKYFRLLSPGKGSPPPRPVTAAAPVLTVLRGPCFSLSPKGLPAFPPILHQPGSTQALGTHLQGTSCPGEQAKGQKGGSFMKEPFTLGSESTAPLSTFQN